jgi:catechol 2,3-dioxygenase-like lactoylglutathione lyase family enzyme
MARIDHVAFETDDPDRLAAFYERILDARIVKTEGHPVWPISAIQASRFMDRTAQGRTRPSG